MKVRILRPFSAIEYIGYGYMGEQREIRVLLKDKIYFLPKLTILFNKLVR